MRRPGLLRQPLPRRGDIGHPLAAGQHMALLDPALRPEFARAVAVRQQHRMAGLQAAAPPSRGSAAAPARNARPVRRSRAARSRSETARRPPACRAARAGSGWPREYRPDAGPATARHPRRQATAKSVRNSVADSGRIGLGRIMMALRIQRTMSAILPRRIGRNSSQLGGFRERTGRPIYDRSNPENTLGRAPRGPADRRV